LSKPVNEFEAGARENARLPVKQSWWASQLIRSPVSNWQFSSLIRSLHSAMMSCASECEVSRTLF